MKKKLHKSILTLVLSMTFMLSMSLTVVANQPIQVEGATLSDFLEKETLGLDPVKLISLAIMQGVDYENIKVGDRNIVDCLTDSQKMEYNFCASTVQAYRDAVDNAKAGLKNGWDTQLIINYMAEAYDTYDTYIADVLTVNSSTEEIESAIKNYIEQVDVLTTDLGEINDLIISTFSGQKLISLQVTEPIYYQDQYGETATTYQAQRTQWATNCEEFICLYSGKVLDITENSITVYVGTEYNKLTMTYFVDEKINLINTALAVGDTVEQGNALFKCNDTSVAIEFKYNEQYIDILKLMGSSGRIIIGDYVKNMSERYDMNREAYIANWLDMK